MTTQGKAEWIHEGTMLVDISGGDYRVLAFHVDPVAGPLLAEAPAMLALLRDVCACGEPACDVCALLARVDGQQPA